jgi:plastocyanin
MLDFTYSQLDLIVPLGSTVTWFNAGEFEHSATADNGSFDTTLLANGEQSSIIFNEPGVFPYYCILHGGPGGVGMAATITVIEE